MTAEVIPDNLIMINTDKRVIPDKLSLTVIIKIFFHVPEGLLLVVWSSVGLLVQSFYFATGWVVLKKLDSRTTLCRLTPIV